MICTLGIDNNRFYDIVLSSNDLRKSSTHAAFSLRCESASLRERVIQRRSSVRLALCGSFLLFRIEVMAMARAKGDKLTTRQRRFVEAYDGNATQAAIAAGYSEKTARFMGRENLTKPYILAEIKSRETVRCTPLIASRAERQQFWSSVMRDKEQQMRDRLKAAELLGKSEADFVERQEITGRDGAPLLDGVTVKFVE